MKLLIVLLLLCIPANAVYNKEWGKLILNLYNVSFLEDPAPKYVLFSIPNCSPCLYQKILIAKYMKQYESTIQFHEVNCFESSTKQYLCHELKVNIVPDNRGYKDGKMVFRLNRTMTKKEFHAYMRILQ